MTAERVEGLSEEMLERLANQEPARLLALIRGGSLSPAWLGIALEMAGTIDDQSTVQPLLIGFLSNPSPAVREGAVTGLANYLPDTESILRRVSQDDASPGVRTAARIHAGVAVVTARERAQHIGRLLREFNLGEGRMDAIEREILAAEREAVRTFAAEVINKFMVTPAGLTNLTLAHFNNALAMWLGRRDLKTFNDNGESDTPV